MIKHTKTESIYSYNDIEYATEESIYSIISKLENNHELLKDIALKQHGDNDIIISILDESFKDNIAKLNDYIRQITGKGRE